MLGALGNPDTHIRFLMFVTEDTLARGRLFNLLSRTVRGFGQGRKEGRKEGKREPCHFSNGRGFPHGLKISSLKALREASTFLKSDL
jgi:hypothetical protein